MKEETYKQCRFKRDGDTAGTYETIGYIPAWAAVVGNHVQLKSLDNKFWQVTEAGNEVPASFVRDNERNYKQFQESLKGGGIDQ